MFYQQNLLNKVIEENPEIISTSLACLSDSSSVQDRPQRDIWNHVNFELPLSKPRVVILTSGGNPSTSMTMSKL